MEYYRIRCEIYKAVGKSWERMVEELPLSAIRGGGKGHGGKVVRLIFLIFCENNQEYQLQRSFLEQWVDDHFVSPCSVLSFVAQKPLVGELVMEVRPLPAAVGEEATVEERIASSVRYLRVTSGHYREMIVGELYADGLTLPIHGQSEQVFRKTEEILRAEQMSFGDIIRQWGYLERIMDIVYGNQCYQDFNDIRLQFYASSGRASEYPVAIGVGTQHSGILVDFNAVKGGIGIIPLGNDWRKATHVYSDEVLISHRVDVEKGIPKFERGKLLSDHQQEMTYTSGTAATRGEESTMTGDMLVQTEITLENIQHLTGPEERREKLPEHPGKLELLRMYLKHEEGAKIVKEDMDKLCPDVPIVCLCTSVCREGLLVEIEGVVYL